MYNVSKEVQKCRIDELVEVSLMWESNLAPEPKAEGGGKSEVTLVKEDVGKAGGRTQAEEDSKYMKEV